MSDDQAAMVAELVAKQAELDEGVDAVARAVAHGLIQGYIGPDHRVLDMPSFYSALVQALKAAREKGMPTVGVGEREPGPV